MVLLKTFHYITLLVFNKLRVNELSKPWYIVIKHTYGKSFKFPDEISGDLLLIPKYFIKTLKYPISKNTVFTKNKLIFDNVSKSAKIREEYVSYFGELKHEKVDFAFYEELKYFDSRITKQCYFLLGFGLTLLLMVFSFFKKNKGAYALILDHFIVLNNLIDKLKNKQTKEVFYFSTYELESNILAKVFQNEGVHVIKIPSEVPISLWNKCILTDTLIICNAYQLEELDFHKSTIVFDKTLFWGPELILDYLNLYKSNEFVPPKNTIGFYSTASWVRVKEGHINQGVDMYQTELDVLTVLNELGENIESLKIKLFLHPKEKSSLYLSEAKRRYNDLLSDVSFEIVDVSKPSAFYFHEIDLAVAFNSTLMYERLYCGFKSLLMPNNPNFPIPNSSMENICAKNMSELKELILNSLNLSTFEFFQKNDILHYSPNLQERKE